MTSRPIQYAGAADRGYDHQQGWLDHVKATHGLFGALSGQQAAASFMYGLGYTQAGATLTFLAGGVLVNTPVDPTTVGNIPVDTTSLWQSAEIAATTLVLAAPALSAGAPVGYTAVYATFATVDEVRPNDPDGGIVPFYNSANPTLDLNGKANNGQPMPTRRRLVGTLHQVSWLPSAAPSFPAGTVYFLIATWAYGNATPVMSTDPAAQVLAGLLKQHHTGVAGQAPKIVLTNGLEVQGLLPITNIAYLNYELLTSSALGNSTGSTAVTTTGVVPVGARAVFCRCVGGGGPGGSGNSGGGGGGSAAGYLDGWYNITPAMWGSAFILSAGAPTNSSTITINGIVVALTTGGGGGAAGGSAIVAGSTSPGSVTTNLLMGGNSLFGQSGGNGILSSALLIGGQGGSVNVYPGGLATFGPSGTNTGGNGGAPGAGGSGGIGSGAGGVGGGGVCALAFFS